MSDKIPSQIAQAESAKAYREQRREQTIRGILQDVAELPDRTSPADQPDAMLVTADELRAILLDWL